MPTTKGVGAIIDVGHNTGIDAQNRAIHFHETGHHLEMKNPDLIRKNREYIESRRTGPNADLHDNNPVYDKGEIYSPDNFISDYVGRVYTDKLWNGSFFCGF